MPSRIVSCAICRRPNVGDAPVEPAFDYILCTAKFLATTQQGTIWGDFMDGWLRRIRGAIGMGLIWGAAWFGVGMIMLLGLLLVTGETGADVPYPLGFGAFGFVAGVAFSGLLGAIEGRRRFDQMSMPRFAGWGATGGLLLSVVFVGMVGLVEDPAFLGNLVVLGPVFAMAGGASAAGALALARRAADPALPEAGGETGEAGLPPEEARELGDGVAE